MKSAFAFRTTFCGKVRIMSVFWAPLVVFVDAAGEGTVVIVATLFAKFVVYALLVFSLVCWFSPFFIPQFIWPNAF